MSSKYSCLILLILLSHTAALNLAPIVSTVLCLLFGCTTPPPPVNLPCHGLQELCGDAGKGCCTNNDLFLQCVNDTSQNIMAPYTGRCYTNGTVIGFQKQCHDPFEACKAKGCCNGLECQFVSGQFYGSCKPNVTT